VQQGLSKFILRRNARMCVVQLSTQRELTDEWNVQDFLSSEDAWGWGEFDEVIFSDLCARIELHWERSRELASEFLQAWDWDRMEIAVRSILRCAVSELLTGTPSNIVITEYLKIGSAFYKDANEVNFLRSVLSAIVQKKFASQNASVAVIENQAARSELNNDKQLVEKKLESQVIPELHGDHATGVTELKNPV